MITGSVYTSFGIKLVVVPSSFMVRRSWRERLFSRPWRPRQAFTAKPNPAAPPDGQLIRFGDTYHGTEATIDMIRKHTELAVERPASSLLPTHGSLQ